MALLNLSDPGLGNQLAQANPGVMASVQVYSPVANIEAKVETIMITNNSVTPAVCQVFNDDDGSVFNNTTRIFKGTVPANGTVSVDSLFYLGNSAANLAVQTSVITDVTFTVYGTEKGI